MGEAMSDTYDVIVIGSGFGGAVTACRLAQKGMKVLVLERGRRWKPEDYPREPGDPWIFDQARPHINNGWIDFRLSLGVCTVQGAGVGGGSLIYANVSINAKKEVFDFGWPREITYDELLPYYQKVDEQLKPVPVPSNQVTARYKLMREGANKLGYADRFQSVPLAVTFDPNWSYDLENPFDASHSRAWTNPQGLQQGTCVHCGNCIAGCKVNARNTLDLTYIPIAEQHGAEVRPLHVVELIAPENGGYRVEYSRLENGRRIKGSETARKVILAAGSIGSTELLLRCRDQYKTMRRLSNMLGYRWCTNGDFLTFSFHDKPIRPSRGPTISSAIDFLDGAADGQQLFIEDGGFPDAFRQFVEQYYKPRFRSFGMYSLLYTIGKALQTQGNIDNMMIWFGQSIDAATGRLHLTRHPLKPWSRVLSVKHDRVAVKGPVKAMIAMHNRLSDATGGKFLVPQSWSLFRKLTTPHPLGGCSMGGSAQDGVVDHRGEVFGYPGLYVADGAIIPKAIGLNPSKTIAALAERTADLMEP